MKVLYVATEVAPFVKTGGLADVAGSLPAALNRVRAYTRVMMPLYESIGPEWRGKMKLVKYTYVRLGWRQLYCGILEMKQDGVTYYFLDNEYYFKRPEVYGHFDDGERFAFFSRAVAECLGELDWVPDVVHLNDWTTALVPIYMRELAGEYPKLADMKTVFTIHNVEYQGRYGKEILGEVMGLSDQYFYDGTLEFMGGVSLMKGAILTADYVTTVSPTYAEELHYSYFAKGLEGVIAARGDRFRGILNGIDEKRYDPRTDEMITQNYGPDTLELKAENKKILQNLFGLKEDPEVPMLACVSRLTAHKGFDLIMSMMDRIMGLGVQFVLLGSGDWTYEQFFANAKSLYPGTFAANIAFSNEMAMRIYAGADFFLMPSRTEPCGISQMLAMRYGTVPIVRETGGLKDTVPPFSPATGEGRGFTFANYNAHDLFHVVGEAVAFYRDDKERMETLRRRCMEGDFGWANSAREYKRLYSEITGKK